MFILQTTDVISARLSNPESLYRFYCPLELKCDSIKWAYNKSVHGIFSTGGIWRFPLSEGNDGKSAETSSKTGTCKHKVNYINTTNNTEQYVANMDN